MEYTEEERVKLLRDYFEMGCLCIINGELKISPNESNEAAVSKYYKECKCSRHPEYKRKENNQ